MKKRVEEKQIKDIRTLLFKAKTPVRIINAITIYRIVTFPLLLFLIFTDRFDLFKWFLLASFFTDAIDGFLARKYQAASVLGAKLDSIGDDLTVLAAVIGLFAAHFHFIEEQWLLFIVLFGLFLIQLILSLKKYKKMSSFHTYLAKIAAVVTAVFLLSVFFFEQIIYPLFYAAFVITALELIEETVIVFFLRSWKTNVKGLYWVIKGKAGI